MANAKTVRQESAALFADLASRFASLSGTRDVIFRRRFETFISFIRKWPETRLGPLEHQLAIEAFVNRIAYDPPYGIYGVLAQIALPEILAQQRSLWAWRLYVVAANKGVRLRHVVRLDIADARRLVSGPRYRDRLSALVADDP